MPVPWLRLLNAALGIADYARQPAPRPRTDDQQQLAPGGMLGHLETRLAGVMVAALKEAFDRDTRRLELEHEQIEAERRRAERALKLEVLRQAADREIARLRLLSAVAVGSWFTTLFFVGRLAGGVPVRAALAGGWALLLAALASALLAQSQLTDALGRMSESEAPPAMVTPSVAGRISPWLIVAGLALIGTAVLLRG